jgi:hypothetical protein
MACPGAYDKYGVFHFIAALVVFTITWPFISISRRKSWREVKD